MSRKTRYKQHTMQTWILFANLFRLDQFADERNEWHQSVGEKQKVKRLQIGASVMLRGRWKRTGGSSGRPVLGKDTQSQQQHQHQHQQECSQNKLPGNWRLGWSVHLPSAWPPVPASLSVPNMAAIHYVVTCRADAQPRCLTLPAKRTLNKSIIIRQCTPASCPIAAVFFTHFHSLTLILIAVCSLASAIK